MADLYNHQDWLVAGIHDALLAPISDAWRERIKDRPTEELDANSLVVLAQDIVIVDRASRDRKRSLLERAVTIDPDYAWAHAVLGRVIQGIVGTQFSDNPERDAIQAVEHVDRAIALAPNAAGVLAAASAVHRVFGNETLALKLAEQGTARNGRPIVEHYQMLIYVGRSEEVFDLAKDDPSPPQVWLACADLLSDRLEEAVERFETIVTASPNQWNSWALLANALALVDRIDEARDALARVKSIVPTWTLGLFEKGAHHVWRNKDELVNMYVSGLRKLEID